MTDTNMRNYKEKYSPNKDLTAFWDNLKTGYDKFIQDKSELNIKVSGSGDYIY